MLKLCRPVEAAPTRERARSASVSKSKNRFGVLKIGGEWGDPEAGDMRPVLVECGSSASEESWNGGGRSIH